MGLLFCIPFKIFLVNGWDGRDGMGLVGGPETLFHPWERVCRRRDGWMVRHKICLGVYVYLTTITFFLQLSIELIIWGGRVLIDCDQEVVVNYSQLDVCTLSKWLRFLEVFTGIFVIYYTHLSTPYTDLILFPSRPLQCLPDATFQCKPKRSRIPASRHITQLHTMRRPVHQSPLDPRTTRKRLGKVLHMLLRDSPQRIRARQTIHHRHIHFSRILGPIRYPQVITVHTLVVGEARVHGRMDGIHVRVGHGLLGGPQHYDILDGDGEVYHGWFGRESFFGACPSGHFSANASNH